LSAGVLCLGCALLAANPPAARADAALDDYNLAVGLYKQKRWDLSAESFQKFVQNYPRHEKIPLARLYLGLTLVNADKFTEAREVLRGYAKDYPQSRNAADALYRVAECSYLLSDLKNAEEEFQAFLEKHPKHELAEWALPYLADTQLRLNKPDRSAETFQKSIEQFPSGRLVEDSKFGLARSYEVQKKTDEAIALYRQIAADHASPRAAQSQFNLAACEFDSGRFAEASKDYELLVSEFPESNLVPLALLNSGYSHFQTGDYQKAIGQFDLAAKTPAQSPTAGYWKGVSLKALREFKEAAAVLKGVFEGEPAGAMAENALYQWADCELRAENFDAARERFLEVAQRWPKGELADDALLERFGREHPGSALRLHQEVLRARVLDAEGRALESSGDAEGAKQKYKAAVAAFAGVVKESKLPRTVSLARFHMGRTQQRMAEHEQVVETLGPLVEEVVKEGESSEFIDALVMQGRSLQALKRYDEAGAVMSQYLTFRPQGELADQALATRAVSHAHAGREDQMESDLRSLAVEHPRSPLVGSTLLELAEGAFAAGNWAGSEKLFDSLVKLGADTNQYVAGLSGLAWSRYQQKKFAEAGAEFARIAADHAEDALAPEAAFMQGECLREAGQGPESVAAFDKAFEKYAPAEPVALAAADKGPRRFAYQAGLSAARVLRSLKQVDEADKAYERVATRFQKSEQMDLVLNEWAILNYEVKNYARSDEIFQRLVNDHPESALADNARLSLAESQLEPGHLDAAAGIFRELVASDKSDDEVREVSLFHLVGIGVEQRKWSDVVRDAEQFAAKYEKSPRRPEVEFYLGEAQLHEKNAEGARKTLEKLRGEIAGAPAEGAPAWHQRVWVLLAESLVQTKQYDELAAVVEDLRKRDPESRWLYQADEILGRGYKNQAKFEEARAAFQRAIDHPAGRRTETAAKSQFLLAETYMLQKDYKRAQEAYLRVYHLYKFPDWQAPALFQAAACDELLNQWASAVRTYEELLREFADHEFAAKAKSRLDIARTKAAG